MYKFWNCGLSLFFYSEQHLCQRVKTNKKETLWWLWIHFSILLLIHFQHGTHWQLDTCTSCSCTDGTVHCQVQQCSNEIDCPKVCPILKGKSILNFGILKIMIVMLDVNCYVKTIVNAGFCYSAVRLIRLMYNCSCTS